MEEAYMFKVGDKIWDLEIDGEIYSATCQDVHDDGSADFLLDDFTYRCDRNNAEKWCEKHEMRLPTISDLEKWELMNTYRNRVSGHKGDTTTDCWWLADKIKIAHIVNAYMDSYGEVDSTDTDFWYGVRPVVTI